MTSEQGTGGTPAADLSGFDQAISDLHSRIADLQGSVGEIGSAAPREGTPPPEAPPPAYPPPAYAPPPPDPYAAPPAEGGFPPPPVADPYAPPDPYGPPQPPAYSPPPQAYAPPPVAEQQWAPPPPVAYPEPYAPAPPEGSDALGNFFRVDIGPFEDLLAMTAFEEQLSALPSMADVRVRRFGARRAEIELELIGQAPLAREVLRVAPDAETIVQPDGTLTVELHAAQWIGSAPEQALAEEPESPTAGDLRSPHADPGELPPEQGDERG